MIYKVWHIDAVVLIREEGERISIRARKQTLRRFHQYDSRDGGGRALPGASAEAGYINAVDFILPNTNILLAKRVSPYINKG